MAGKSYNKPYIDYAFVGLKPFIKSLYEAGVSYDILTDKNIDRVFDESEFLNRNTDSISIGLCEKEGKSRYFIECCILLDQEIRSYYVFIYDHYPSFEDIIDTVNDIETLTIESLIAFRNDSINELLN